MRRDHGPARVAAAGGASAALVVLAVAVPWANGAPRSTLPDLLVVVGFAASAVWLSVAGHRVAATALWVAAAVWTVTGFATSLPDALETPVARLVLVPHALAVVALAAGQVTGRRVVVPVVVAAAAALAAAGGLALPVLGLLGAAVLATLLLGWSSTSPGIRAATAGLGVALVVVDPHALGDALTPDVLANVVDLLLLGIAATATRQLTADRLHLADVTATDRGHDEVGPWLARVLGVPRLDVAFPAGAGVVDSAGQPAALPDDAMAVGNEGGVAAYVSPAVPLEPTIREPLVSTLCRLGEVARLRAECREQATAIVASRGRLQAAADEESRRLERQLDRTLLARLDRIDALLRASSASALTERVQDVRVELLRHARGLDPLAGRSLEQALAVYRSRGVSVDVEALGTVDPTSARTAWYVATEGITNAAKHAPGSSVRLHVAREGGTLRVVVADSGPGGAHLRGTGLQGLADRVAAAGGELTVTSGSAGTTVSCALPGKGFPATQSREIADSVPTGRS